MNWQRLAPGVGFACLLAWVSILIANSGWVKTQLHFSPLLIVVLLGMLIGSTVRLPDSLQEGVKYCQKPVLRLGVGLLGIRVSLQQISTIGISGVVTILICTAVTFLAGVWLVKLFKLDWKLGWLLATGTSICGASAIIAADTVVQSESKDSALSLAIITLWGTVGIFVYPLLNGLLHWGSFAYGSFCGATLHEVAQVVAAGSALDAKAQSIATIVKLARICLLAPMVVGMGWWLRRNGNAATAKVAIVPWFLVLFVVLASTRSLIHSTEFDRIAKDWIEPAISFVLSVGMAGVGLQSNFRDVFKAGWKPVAFGFVLWLIIAALGFVCVTLLS